MNFKGLFLIIIATFTLAIGCKTEEDCDKEWAKCMDNLPPNYTYEQLQACQTRHKKCLNKLPYGYLVSPTGDTTNDSCGCGG